MERKSAQLDAVGKDQVRVGVQAACCQSPHSWPQCLDSRWHQLAAWPCLSPRTTGQPTSSHRQCPEHACSSGTQAPSAVRTRELKLSWLSSFMELRVTCRIGNTLEKNYTTSILCLVLDNVTFCISKIKSVLSHINPVHLNFSEFVSMERG